MSDTTAGFLLAGRVRHEQKRTGHRTGIEPVLLAASVPARPGARVLEGGCGAGAALLCLASRVPGLAGLGIEHDPALATLAARNADANGFEGLQFIAAELTGWRTEAVFDHAIANPPWHAAGGTASPDAGRESARRADGGLFAAWAQALARPLRHHGTLTFVVASAHLPACLAVFTQVGCGTACVLPLWPRSGTAAKLALVRGIKGGRGAFRLLPGLVLHESGDGYTAAADAILRDGAAIIL